MFYTVGLLVTPRTPFLMKGSNMVTGRRRLSYHGLCFCCSYISWRRVFFSVDRVFQNLPKKVNHKTPQLSTWKKQVQNAISTLPLSWSQISLLGGMMSITSLAKIDKLMKVKAKRHASRINPAEISQRVSIPRILTSLCGIVQSARAWGGWRKMWPSKKATSSNPHILRPRGNCFLWCNFAPNLFHECFLPVRLRRVTFVKPPCRPPCAIFRCCKLQHQCMLYLLADRQDSSGIRSLGS